jgi:hypothetical protein
MPETLAVLADVREQIEQIRATLAGVELVLLRLERLAVEEQEQRAPARWAAWPGL